MEQPGILIIEADYDDANLAQRILKKYRIANRVETVRDGKDAIRVLRRADSGSVPAPGGAAAKHGESTEGAVTAGFIPELILLGSLEPGIPSMEIAIRIRGLAGLDQVPVIVCCESPDEEHAVKLWNMRRVVSLSKPVGFFKLLECIQKLEMHWQVFASKP